MSPERMLKTVHGWLGIMILPWVIMAGLTGIYMNHSALVLSLLPKAPAPEQVLADQPLAEVTPTSVLALAAVVLPGDATGRVPTEARFQARKVYKIAAGDSTLYVDRSTGAYWLSTPFLQRLYLADGARIQTSVRWSRLLNRLHRRGWTSDTLGTWPADLTAAALMIFGVSGLYLFTAPRLRRLRNRRVRRRAGAPS